MRQEHVHLSQTKKKKHDYLGIDEVTKIKWIQESLRKKIKRQTDQKLLNRRKTFFLISRVAKM